MSDQTGAPLVDESTAQGVIASMAFRRAEGRRRQEIGRIAAELVESGEEFDRAAVLARLDELPGPDAAQAAAEMVAKCQASIAFHDEQAGVLSETAERLAEKADRQRRMVEDAERAYDDAVAAVAAHVQCRAEAAAILAVAMREADDRSRAARVERDAGGTSAQVEEA